MTESQGYQEPQSGKPDEFERVAKIELKSMRSAYHSVNIRTNIPTRAIDALTAAHRAVVERLEAQLAEARAQVPKVVRPVSTNLKLGPSYYCPECERELALWMKACHCGAKLDWSVGGEAGKHPADGMLGDREDGDA
jgi:hypothetical protein